MHLHPAVAQGAGTAQSCRCEVLQTEATDMGLPAIANNPAYLATHRRTGNTVGLINDIGPSHC